MTGKALEVKLWRLSICHAVTVRLDETRGEKGEGEKAQREPQQKRQSGWTAAKRQMRSRCAFVFICIFWGIFGFFSKYHLHHSLVYYIFIYLFIFECSVLPNDPQNRGGRHTTHDRYQSWRDPDLSIMMSKLFSYMSTGCSVKRYIKHREAPQRTRLPSDGRRRTKRGKLGSSCEKDGSARHHPATLRPPAVARPGWDRGQSEVPPRLQHPSFTRWHEGAGGLINFRFNPKRDIKSINSGVNHWSKYLSGSRAGLFLFPGLQTLK